MHQEPLMLEKQSILRERTLTFLDVPIFARQVKNQWRPITLSVRNLETQKDLVHPRGDFDWATYGWSSCHFIEW